MRVLTEAELIEIERRARRLATLASDYADDGERADMDKQARQNARELLAELSASTAEFVATICERLRRSA